MKQIYLLLLLAIGVRGLQVTRSTPWKTYRDEMQKHVSECGSIAASNKVQIVNGASCGRQNCNYPSQVCVGVLSSNDVFGTTTYRCETVSSNCKRAVSSGGSGSGGGSQTTNPTTRPPQPTATTRRSFTTTTRRPTTTTRRLGTTSAARTTTPPRSSGDCPLCNTEACTAPRAQGRFPAGRRSFTRAYFYDTAEKKCRGMLYFGSGGNRNRYSTQDACERSCVRGRDQSGGSSGTTTAAPQRTRADCSRPARQGAVTRSSPRRCSGSGERFSFFRSTRFSFCTSFVFNGCSQPTGNNFATREECNSLCNPTRG